MVLTGGYAEIYDWPFNCFLNATIIIIVKNGSLFKNTHTHTNLPYEIQMPLP